MSPSRHTLRPGDWASLFGRLQELVLANSGEDAFEEVFKLVVAKLHVERHPAAGAWPFPAAGGPGEAAAAFDALLARAAARWPGVLPGEPASRLAPAHLAVCGEALADVTLEDAGLEVMDAAFEHLVSHAAKGAKGQFFTPRPVAALAIAALAPRPGEVVLDPACGSGGFLLQALRHADGPVLRGADIDARAVHVARALMLVAGAERAAIARANSLEEALELDPAGVDVIATNPPFAGEVREPALLAGYELARGKPRVERDLLFLERCVRLLKPGGRLAIVLPHNKLAAGAYAPARAWLLRHLQVVAVVGLARPTFLPHTHQKAGLLFGVKRAVPLAEPPGAEVVRFFVSERAGKDAKGRVVRTPDGAVDTDLPALLPGLRAAMAAAAPAREAAHA